MHIHTKTTGRLNGHNLKSPTSCSLCDAVNSMADRATSTVTLLQSEFLGDGNKSNDEIIYHALEVIYMELQDIKEVVENFSKRTYGK